MEQSNMPPIKSVPVMNCMDCDDMAPSWLSPDVGPLAIEKRDNQECQDGPQGQVSLTSDKTFQSRSSTTSEYNRAQDTNDSIAIKSNENDTFMQHSFSLGRRSFSEDHTKSWGSMFLRDNLSMGSIEDEDSEFNSKDLDVADIYRSTGDIPGALLYKTETERRAVSQKIGSIGRAGQNISLGHILGRAQDESMLIPSRLKVVDTYFVLDESSPIQTDVKWCPPDNASQFQQLVYEVEFCDITSQTCKLEDINWLPVGRVYHPVIRVYRTESSLFVGRHRMRQTGKDTLFKLRVRAQGRLMGKTGPVQMWMSRSQSGRELSHSLAGEWSSDIYLTWVGWDNQGQMTQLTSL